MFFCDINEFIEKLNIWVKYIVVNLVWCKRFGCFEVDFKVFFNVNSWSRIIDVCFVVFLYDLIIGI